jgi:hypothetical protein
MSLITWESRSIEEEAATTLPLCVRKRYPEAAGTLATLDLANGDQGLAEMQDQVRRDIDDWYTRQNCEPKLFEGETKWVAESSCGCLEFLFQSSF